MNKQLLYVILFITCYTESFEVDCTKVNLEKFPDKFLFGAASSAYQIEGGWQQDDKGENIWDRFTHKHPEKIVDGENGEIACDSYNKMEEDIKILKELGVNFYRFSLSWSRIMPKGFTYNINRKGVQYYSDLIDLLVKNQILPMVTLFHFDTPQPLEELGGFPNKLMLEWFEDYARIVFSHFGDRVRYWITFNEPDQICQGGYGEDFRAPGYNSSGIGDYMCAHNLLKAHAKVYHLYNDVFKPIQNGKLSIIVNGDWCEPATESLSDVEAAHRAMDFKLAWFTDPIFGSTGDYPLTMKKFVGKRSEIEGFLESRLPEFTKAEIKYIKGTYDFFALNYFTTLIVADQKPLAIGKPRYSTDMRVVFRKHKDTHKNISSTSKDTSTGFRQVLKWIKNRYNDPEIIVTGNGYSDQGEINDTNRINYHMLHLHSLLDAINNDKVNVIGYSIWSLMDSFEWTAGYTKKFGLYYVNFSDPERLRTPKSSAKFYKEIIAHKRLGNSAASVMQNYALVFIVTAITLFRVPLPASNRERVVL